MYLHQYSNTILQSTDCVLRKCTGHWITKNLFLIVFFYLLKVVVTVEVWWAVWKVGSAVDPLRRNPRRRRRMLLPGHILKLAVLWAHLHHQWLLHQHLRMPTKWPRTTSAKLRRTVWCSSPLCSTKSADRSARRLYRVKESRTSEMKVNSETELKTKMWKWNWVHTRERVLKQHKLESEKWNWKWTGYLYSSLHVDIHVYHCTYRHTEIIQENL